MIKQSCNIVYAYNIFIHPYFIILNIYYSKENIDC